MHKRFLVNTVLAVAVLFSQGGALLIASLCPHLRSVQVSCNMHVAASTMAHDDMGDMAMGSTESMEPMEEPAANPDPDAIALGQPVGPCPHCAVHSRTTPNTVSLRDAEILKRSGSFVIPDTVSPVVSVEMPFAVSLTSRAHGPPGTSTPRHVLINIFRI